jgi:hypothetical protein
MLYLDTSLIVAALSNEAMTRRAGLAGRAGPGIAVDQRLDHHRDVLSDGKLRTAQIDLEQRAATLAMFNKLVTESFTGCRLRVGIFGQRRNLWISIRSDFAPAMPCISRQRRSMARRYIRSQIAAMHGSKEVRSIAKRHPQVRSQTVAGIDPGALRREVPAPVVRIRGEQFFSCESPPAAR